MYLMSPTMQLRLLLEEWVEVLAERKQIHLNWPVFVRYFHNKPCSQLKLDFQEEMTF